MPLLLLTTEALVILMIIGGIALYNFEVFVLLVSTIFPVAYFFNLLVKKRMNRYGRELNRNAAELFTNSNRGIFGFVDVKLRNKEKSLLRDYQFVIKKLNHINLITGVLGIMPAKLFELATVGGLLLLFAYSTFWVQNPALILPLIALYAAAGYRVIPSLSKIVPAFMQLEQYSYLFQVFEKPLKINENQKTIEAQRPLKFENDIEFQNIGFQFIGENTPLFQNVNLTIQKGEIIGLVGKSGSGKTTFVKLLAGFLKPLSGSIFVDGQKLTPDNTTAWMQNISYVQQNPYLESGSLAKNIGFLEDQIDEHRLQNAIKKASLTDYVEGRNPHEIFIEENGKNLSGGQRQRIVIARALYHQAKLIILDEATSALDNETEAAITETVQNLKGTGVTIIIIAHRLSTLNGVTKVWEIQKGEAKEKKSIYD